MRNKTKKEILWVCPVCKRGVYHVMYVSYKYDYDCRCGFPISRYNAIEIKKAFQNNVRLKK